MLGRADAVVAAVPETPETIGLMDAAAFAAMKPGSFFCNVGRGSLVDEPALDRGARTRPPRGRRPRRREPGAAPLRPPALGRAEPLPLAARARRRRPRCSRTCTDSSARTSTRYLAGEAAREPGRLEPGVLTTPDAHPPGSSGPARSWTRRRRRSSSTTGVAPARRCCSRTRPGSTAPSGGRSRRRLVEAGRHVFSFDFRGHGASPQSAVGLRLVGFADDVLTVVDGLGLAGDPALLPAGHSKGGAAFLLAEAAAPGTFPRIWCYEPIVIPGEPTRARRRRPARRGSAAPARRVGLARRGVRRVRRRARRWTVLDPDALRAYVERGFRDIDGRVALVCRPDDEAEMYALRAAHDAWRRLPEVHCPVHVVCGDATDAMTPRLCERVVDRLPDATLEVRPGLGHFGPLQDPAGAVESMLAFARS